MAGHVAGHIVYSRAMRPSRTLSVSELKNKLLEIVRRVEQGEVFEITKGGAPVAILSPKQGTAKPPATGFARVEIKGSLELAGQIWTYDAENLKRRPRRQQ